MIGNSSLSSYFTIKGGRGKSTNTELKPVQKKKDWVDFELEVLMIQSASERLSLNLQYQLQLELYHNHDFVESGNNGC